MKASLRVSLLGLRVQVGLLNVVCLAGEWVGPSRSTLTNTSVCAAAGTMAGSVAGICSGAAIAAFVPDWQAPRQSQGEISTCADFQFATMLLVLA